MATTGTYAFNPGLGELLIYAFGGIQVRPAELTQQHMFDARIASNLINSRWSNQGVNLWAVDLVTVTLVEGQATYDVDADTVMILDAYMRIDDGNEDPTDRLIMPISRSEYAAYPNKDMQGFTTVFWFDRLLSPTVTLWPVPDGSSAQYLKYYRVRQIQDASFTGNKNVEIPFLWLDAYSKALTAELALNWRPEAADRWEQRAEKAYSIAAMQNVEQAQQYLSPQISQYYRP